MKYSSRVPIAILVAAIGIGATPGSVDRVTVVRGSPQDHEAVAWAVDRFEKGGLTVPEIEVEFHADDQACDGADGIFRVSQDPVRIDVCTPNRYIVLHELAHAWDYFTLSDAMRQEFMQLRGLSEWSSYQVPWSERGIEDLAEIVTWGLHEQPLMNDAAEKEHLFRMITGGLAPSFHRAVESEPVHTRSEDPMEADTDWDMVR